MSNETRGNTFDALVREERSRQDKKWGPECPQPLQMVSVLTEELGEVARAVNDGDAQNLEDELVQVAASARKFYEWLPPRETPPQKRSCNRHDDCVAAEAKYSAEHGGKLMSLSAHCYDDCCEDCFGT